MTHSSVLFVARANFAGLFFIPVEQLLYFFNIVFFPVVLKATLKEQSGWFSKCNALWLTH